MKISAIISILFLTSTHPLSMILVLISMTMTIAFFSYSTLKTLWFSFILILLMLGGMLILFVYISSLTPNKKFKTKKWIIIFLLPIYLYLLTNKQKNTFSMTKENIFQFNLNESTFLLIFITIYLFFTLMAIMKMINSFMTPLRISN
nr:NADH dehydrogenase subunit 6 [Ogadenus brumpti ssp. 1 BJM-2017]QLD96930.1 NADH dehydrogenase subunit 6 [Ogadenus brumpti ssp. 1 BJM-2017]UYB77908.1 NADH dehydrogenase subunit 6 [Ogadenus brumpti]UYB77921.1 NADH dehydrogenase subunit 6 [Ogadenus brumpti]